MLHHKYLVYLTLIQCLRDMGMKCNFHAFMCVAVTPKEEPQCKLTGNTVTHPSLKDQNYRAGSSPGKAQFP